MEKYDRISRLGKGGCGAVFLVRHKESRKLFALKTVELDERKKTRTKEAVLKEARILAQLKHPHIVLYHESFFDDDVENLNIIQDYCDGGNLDDTIKDAARKRSYFDEKQIMQWFIQIIMAVQYIHSKKVLHRDLKAENVFLTKKSVIKIGDFGISKVLENTIDVAQTIVGTPSYLSPELCQDIPYSSKSDIWAVGCLLYEMCSLRQPFDAQNLISLFFKIIKCEYDVTQVFQGTLRFLKEPIPSHYSSELQDLVKLILVKTPDDRPSASAILNISLLKTHLAMFIKEKESLLVNHKLCKEDTNVGPGTGGIRPGLASGKNSASNSPALKRNKLRIAKPMIQRSSKVEERSPKVEARSPKGEGHDGGSGLGISAETVADRLEVPKPEQDAASDYSDDFDSSPSEDEDVKEDDIEEDIHEEDSDSEIEDVSGQDTTDTTVEYADDFEEYDSSEDLDQMVCQAKEAQDIEAVDDWFADSLSEMYFRQTMVLKQQLGGRELKEVGQLVSDGTLTEDDLRPQMKRSVGEDHSEICHLNIDDLDIG